MAVFETHIEADYRWGIWKMEETEDDLLSLFSDPFQIKEKMQHLSAKGRRLEWLSVRALLKSLCGEEKQIEYYPSGMPYLSDQSFYISISHTRGYVAVILSAQKKVGIDIEQYGERILKLGAKFLSEQEIKAVNPDKEVYHLLLYWSGKETVFKVLGEQVADFKKYLLIEPFVPEEKGAFNAKELKTDAQQCFLVYYQTHPDFVITWC